MRPILTLIIALFVAVSTVFAQGDLSSRAYNTGKIYMQEKKYDEAINSFTEAINLRPSDSAYANLGFAFIQKGDDQNALIILNKALDLNEDYAWAYGLRGFLYTKIDAPELSFSDFSKAIKLNAANAKKYNSDKKAAREYRKELASNPGNVDAFYGLQDLYLNKGVKQKNIPVAADSTIDTTVQFTQLYATEGTSYSSIEEKYALMIKDFTKVISVFPQVSAAYRDRGYIYAKSNKIDSAIADFTKAIEIDPQSSAALGFRGALYIETQQPDLAIADLSRAIKIDPAPYQFYNNRGLAYYHKGEYEPAIQDFTKLISIDSGNASAYRHRGNLYTYLSKPALAIADLNKSIALDPRNAESYAIRGYAHALSKNYEEAIADFTYSIKFDPNNGGTYANRALAYKYQKNYKAALRDLTTAITLNPGDAEAYKERGEIYKELGKKELAEADFKKAGR